jgi:hypothetical protein
MSIKQGLSVSMLEKCSNIALQNRMNYALEARGSSYRAADKLLSLQKINSLSFMLPWPTQQVAPLPQ